MIVDGTPEAGNVNDSNQLKSLAESPAHPVLLTGSRCSTLDATYSWGSWTAGRNHDRNVNCRRWLFGTAATRRRRHLGALGVSRFTMVFAQ